MTGPTRAEVAAMVDHTLLRTDATHADVLAAVAEAAELGVCSVCVSPSMLPLPALHLLRDLAAQADDGHGLLVQALRIPLVGHTGGLGLRGAGYVGL